jgi:phosphoribosyl isomerase A
VGFTLLPAVDVAGGQAVRLAQGVAGTATTHGDPLDVARSFVADGAEWIHLVDLDAAFGRGSNFELLASVIAKLDVKVELSAGIRDDEMLRRALSTGCERVVIGTGALGDRDWIKRGLGGHGNRIAVSLDVRVVEDHDGTIEHRLAARGGTGDSGDLWETIERLNSAGCGRYIVTDVARDGMLNGPNVELYRAVAAATSAPVIASGGIASLGDLVALATEANVGSSLEGAIVGKALYAGRFTLGRALQAVRSRL